MLPTYLPTYLPTLNSTWLGPVRRNLHILPTGVEPCPLQDNIATIFTIANTGAMLIIGQERSKKKGGFNCRARLWPRF